MVSPDVHDWSPGGDPVTNPFFAQADHVLQLAAEVARVVVGSHQSAAALIMNSDWVGARKYFSLSDKYAAWHTYRAPATGYGTHTLPVEKNEGLRLTQAELEAHPAWKNFGREAGTHPPMRGWLAVPLIGLDNRNYGLLQLSDKYDEADFTLEDQKQLTLLAGLTAAALDALCRLYPDHGVGHATQ